MAQVFHPCMPSVAPDNKKQFQYLNISGFQCHAIQNGSKWKSKPRRYIYKDPRQDSGQRNISYKRYLKKCFTRTYKEFYADAGHAGAHLDPDQKTKRTTLRKSNLLYVISRAVRRVKYETILKYHERYLCQISRKNPAIICLYYYPQKVCNFHM